MGRLFLVGLVAALVAHGAAAAGSSAPPARTRTVPCNETIDQTRFPYIGSSRPAHRYRTVLGAISVPPAYLQQIVNTGERPWPYWRKAGLVVRADGRPVTVSVPTRWRDRLRIAWGNADGVFTSIRFSGCTAGPDIGQAFAGGFVLRAPACVPLVFRVGERSATVRFGLGRRCA
jgi:hypothetical protein